MPRVRLPEWIEFPHPALSRRKGAQLMSEHVPQRLHVDGSENIPKRGGVILAPNHRSLIDIPVAAAVTRRQVFFMAKEELFSSKLGAGFISHMGAFPVRRGKPDRGCRLWIRR